LSRSFYVLERVEALLIAFWKGAAVPLEVSHQPWFVGSRNAVVMAVQAGAAYLHLMLR
jgi:hypothetical protein